MSAGTIVALIVAGFLLVFFEVFLPGGVLGVLGGLVVLGAIACGFIFKGPGWGSMLLLISSVSGLISFWLWIKYFPKSPIGRRLILQRDAHDWHGADEDQKEYLGKRGTAHTTLRPAGMAVIEGARVDVVTRGEMIEAKTPIEVIEVEGNRIVVTTVE